MDARESRPVVLITGASTGIGRAAASVFSGAGYRVALLARHAERLQEVADAIGKTGGDALACPGDVTRPTEVQAAVDRVLEAWGAIDVLVNNAGIQAYGPFTEVSAADFAAVLETNFCGAIHVTRAVLPGMLRRRRGMIVNISSPSGKRAIPGIAAYSASKAAMNAWSDALRVELRAQGIAVVVVLPDQTESELYVHAPVTVSSGWVKDRILRAPRDKADVVARHILAATRRGQRERYTRWRSRLLPWADLLAPRVLDWLFGRWMR